MNFVRLLVLGLLLAAVAPTVAKACSCVRMTPESVMRGGNIVARVLVLERSRTDEEYGYSATATAFVQESFVGPLPSRLIEVHWTRERLINCPMQPMPLIGRTGIVLLYPSPDQDNVYSLQPCSIFPIWEDDALEILESYARLRAQEEGVWVDTVAFQRLINPPWSGPPLSVLRLAFPEVEFIIWDEAPPELQVSWFDIWIEQRNSNVDLSAPFRADQSRFIADMRDGRVVGGEFR